MVLSYSPRQLYIWYDIDLTKMNDFLNVEWIIVLADREKLIYNGLVVRKNKAMTFGLSCFFVFG